MNCQAKGCDREARCAIRTLDDPFRTTVYMDDRQAPKSAASYCKEHGTEVIMGLMALVHNDSEVVA